MPHRARSRLIDVDFKANLGDAATRDLKGGFLAEAVAAPAALRT